MMTAKAMTAPDTSAFLQNQLADCETQWSVGTFGALAEFSRTPQEPAAISQTNDSVSVVTGGGGIRIAKNPGIRLVASESITRRSWSHRVALCLRETDSAMSGRSVFTELGPDRDALRADDCEAVLFDLGLGAVQVDACIRVSDPEVADRLRAFVGRDVFEPGNTVMSIVVPHSPHRVFISRVGRAEVFQPIPPPHGKSPQGPHTHVLPKLLRHRRTHAATEFVPPGFVPCAHLYPSHPVKDSLGEAVAFDSGRHVTFQDMLRQFGESSIVELKQRVFAAIQRGQEPASVAVPDDRFARSSVQVALRQIQASHDHSARLEPWLAAYDASSMVAEVDDAEAMHH